MKHLIRCVSKITIKPSIPPELVENKDNNKICLTKENIINCTNDKKHNNINYKIEMPGKINIYEINFLIDSGAILTVINNYNVYLNEIVPLEINISLEWRIILILI